MADPNRKRRSSFTPGELLMLLAGVLFCLVLISTALLGGLFARYTTSGTGSDNARVAKFGNLTLTETGDFAGEGREKTGIIIPGVDLNKKVAVSFEESEVATIVFVEVSAPGWTMQDNSTFCMGSHLSWSMAEGWNYLGNIQDAYVYYIELPPNTPLSADIIQDGTITVKADIKESNIQSLNNLNLTFRASVIQNDGSLTPATAWDRLK